MASMAHPYGPHAALRKAAIVLACVFFTFTAQAAPLRLLVLGDSLAAGYGLAHDEAFQAKLIKSLREDGRDVTLLDGAVSGDTTAGGLARLDWALGDGADAAIVELGANDGLRGIDPKDTEANLTAILDTLKARHIKVLLCGMYAPPNLGDAYGAAFRAVFERLSKRSEIMFDPFFLAGVAGDIALNQADHIHPNPAGVQLIVARLRPVVGRLLDSVAP